MTIKIIQTPKLKRDMTGKRVRLKYPCANSLASLPKGSLAVVTSTHGGADLTFDKCTHCGVELFVRKVPYHKLQFIEES